MASIASAPAALPGSPRLTLTQAVSQEPLLGGQIAYSRKVSNTGAAPMTDRGYNLTITDTLPIGLSFVGADPAPTLVSPQASNLGVLGVLAVGASDGLARSSLGAVALHPGHTVVH